VITLVNPVAAAHSEKMYVLLHKSGDTHSHTQTHSKGKQKHYQKRTPLDIQVADIINLDGVRQNLYYLNTKCVLCVG